MGRVRISRDVTGSPARAAALWLDIARWPAWVDGFGHAGRVDSSWPAAGSSVVWDSRPGGRGRVLETLRTCEPARCVSTLVEDERMDGRQTVVFTELADGTQVDLALEYRLKNGGPFRALADRLFIQRSVADSLRRTLARFARELADDLDPSL